MSVAHYRVRFIKTLCDDTGHAHKCVEGVVDIRRARDRDRAVQAAKRRFERMKKIPRWGLYADSFELEVEQEESPSSRKRAVALIA
jgi:hypothetical protein